MYQVIKRDGKTEPFDKSKIVSAVTNAKSADGVAQEVADTIVAWLPSAAKDQKVGALLIRREVIKELQKRDPAAAKRMESYKKS